LITNINAPLGRLFNETGHVLKAILLTTTGLIFNLPDFLKYVEGVAEPGEFKSNINNVFFELRAMAMSVGNVVRQFNILGTCPLVNPHENPLTSGVSGPPISQNVDVFCCAAAVIEGLLRIVIELLRMIFLSVVIIFEGVGASQDFGEILLEILVIQRSGDITLELIPAINATIYGALCYSFGGLPIVLRLIDEYIPSIGYFDCASGPRTPPPFGPHRLWEAFWRAISEFFAFLILAQMEVVALVIQVIPIAVVDPSGPATTLCVCRNAIDNPPEQPCVAVPGSDDDNVCGCQLALKIYDAWVGRLMTFIRSLGRFISCLTKIRFVGQIAEKLYEFFGVDGARTLKGDICTIIGLIETIVEFFSLILQGRLDDAIRGLVLEIPAIARIIDSVNAIWNFLVDFSAKAKAYVLCLLARIKEILLFIPKCVASCFIPITSFGDCDKCTLSASCGPVWGDPSPIIVAKRVDENVTDEEIFDLDLNFDPSKTDSPCHEQFLAATSNNSRPADRRDLKICVLSSSFTQIMDLFLFNTNSSDRIVDPMLLYDPFVTIEFIGNATYGAVETFSYLSNMVLENRTDNRTVADYLAERNITDRFSIRAGLILEIFVRAMMNETSSPTLTTLTSIWKYGFQVWFEVWELYKEGDPLQKSVPEENPLGKLSTWTQAFSEMVSGVTGKLGIASKEVQSWWSGVSTNWVEKSGYALQEQHLTSGAYIINTVRSRIQWNLDGRPQDKEPYPLGNIQERRLYGILQRRIKESQTEEEEEHWKSVRAQFFPRWEPVEKKKISRPALIESDCPSRRCWDDVGNVIGGCDLSRITCGCNLFTDRGSCCTGNATFPVCLENVTAGECNGTFVVGVTNCSNSCDAILAVNSSFGACCTPGACELTIEAGCNGTWNAHKTCSNPRLSEKCDNCRNRNLPDIDITSELFCPIASLAGEVSRQPCATRKCRDDEGNEIATCGVDRDPAFGRLQCGCDIPPETEGACCARQIPGPLNPDPPIQCLGVMNFSRCDDLTPSVGLLDTLWAWKANRTCPSCFADEAVAISERGACCHGPPENTTCELTTFEVCVGLDGVFDANTSCDSKNLDGRCNRCQAEGCQECAWFLAVINDVTDAIVGCIDDLIELRDERQNRTLTKPLRPQKSRSFFMPYDPPQREKQIKRAIGTTSLNQWIIFIFESIVNWFISLFGVEGLDFNQLTDDISDFFRNPDPDDPRGLRFWISWLFRCNYQEMSRCDEGRQGLGLERGLLVALIVLTILVGLLFRLWRFLGSLISGAILLGIFIIVTFGVAYFYSPACALSLSGSPPLIPDCICEDIRNGLRKLDVDCLPLCDVACTGTLVCNDFDCECVNATGVCVNGRGDCPGEDVDFRREFPMCHADPYNFNGPFRLFTFAVRRFSPALFCLMEQSDFVLFSWIRELPSGDTAFDFNTETCIERDFGRRWIFCFRTNFWMWFPLVAFVFIGVVIIFFFIGTVIFLLVSLVDLVANFLAFLVEVFSRFGKFGDRKEKYFRESRRYEVSLDDPPRAKGNLTMKDTMKAMEKKIPQARSPGGPTGFNFSGRRHPKYKDSEKRE
jgi:hypothetical protein